MQRAYLGHAAFAKGGPLNYMLYQRLVFVMEDCW
jgi:hypothetical protein